MKKCHDCGQPINEVFWRCQDCFRVLWPECIKKHWPSKNQRRFLERLAMQRKEREQRLAEERHRQQLAEEQRHQQLISQNSLEKTDAKEEGKVYFISDEHDRVKIGYSNHPKRRLKALQSSNPDTLTLLATVLGDKETESAIQAQFSRFQIRDTEWFIADPILLSYVDQLRNSDEELKEAAGIKPR